MLSVEGAFSKFRDAARKGSELSLAGFDATEDVALVSVVVWGAAVEDVPFADGWVPFKSAASFRAAASASSTATAATIATPSTIGFVGHVFLLGDEDESICVDVVVFCWASKTPH